LKKIFSILLSLAMLVSLAALTTTPVSAATECVCPTLTPASGTFDLCNQCGVATNIKWNDASNVTEVHLCDGTNLTQDTDWFLFGCLLVISPDYLKTVLLDCDECICLDVIFDVCVVNFIITATGKDASLDPSKVNWVFGSTDDVFTTIVGCPGNNVVSINDTETGGAADNLTFNTDYKTADNGDGTQNLTIMNTWLAGELWCIGATTKLTINMTWCEDIFLTITAVAEPLPSVSPSTLSYCVAGCCHNICTTIDWADATDISTITDITSPQLASALVRNTDYWLADNNTLIIAGCISGSAPSGWGGLGCRLDAGARLARLLRVTFDDACNTSVILTINSACYTLPTLTPTEIIVDLDAWKCDPLQLLTSKSGAVISLGTATGIRNVTDITGSDCCGGLLYPPTGAVLVSPYQWYMAYAPAYGGNLLAISRKYYLEPTDAWVVAALGLAGATAGANLTQCGRTRTLLINWDPILPSTTLCGSQIASYFGWMYLPTKITIRATALSPTICPTKAEYNIDEANDPVKTEITWTNYVGNITKILESKCSIPELVRDVDYTLVPDGGNCTTPSVLTINDSYLSKVLKNVGDQAVLTIYFGDCGTATFTITATGTPMCFIATAAGADAPQLDILRDFRDEVMRPNPVGAELVSLYYTVSPSIAKFIAGSEFLKDVVMKLVVDPAVSIAQWVMG
jgi:hypothetical protein